VSKSLTLTSHEPDAIRSWLVSIYAHLGITASELARRAGIAPSTLTRFHNNPSFKYRLSATTIGRIQKIVDASATTPRADSVDHPAHYGGASNPYEAIKVIEAWGLGFNTGNTVKYLSRAGKKGDRLEDLRKAAWYLAREIQNEEKARAKN
jgi:transcriptional regulator with XRE-family HTH domain